MNLNQNLLSKALFPFAFIFPFVLSLGVCGPNGALWSCIATVILSLFFDKIDEKKVLPVLLNFTAVSFLINCFGYLSGVIALLISGIIIVCFGSKINNYLFKFSDSPFISGIMLATALTVTVLQTTNYFGIGAYGNTAREMIQSYVSLGFHGNWRGVLYGTIVMVVMITFPRKFKKLSKVIHASLLGLIISTVLNFFLNPSDMITSINEVSELKFNESFNPDVSVWGLFFSLICGVIIALSIITMISSDNITKNDYIKSGIINVILSPLLCFVPMKVDKSIIKNIPFTAISALVLFFLKDIIIRIPVHSCAVILIVSAWQSIEWKRLKVAFENPISFIKFIIPIILFLLY